MLSPEGGVSGQGPAPLALSLSDRAGEESHDARSTATAVTPGPLWGAVRSLDSLDAAVQEASRTEADDAAVGSDAADDGHGPAAPIAGETVEALDPAAGAPEAKAAGETSQGAARREQILDGASALFAERGYHGSSLREISRSVAISHPGMLHHFSSKPALLDAVIDRLEAHAQGLLDSVEALSTSPAQLLAALAGPWHPGRPPITLIATLSAEIVDPEHPGRYRMSRLRLVHEHILKQVLAAYAERGLLTPGTDPVFLSRAVFSLLLSLAVRERSVRALQSSSGGEPVEDVRTFVQHFLNG
ncbi:TetR/AcrR family transcriptional regulator [Brachybacterium sp. NBEC-018]|uniref:TetR/AcrR family transcriptional regulator n=1 Tax=Brachybacterium sp. NBEC-018 TaxID=2996004 RepID=UPI0021754FFA|nr:TetR/AcrR family transcriptional regulator [Brachybacterium sp. NBEC-018]UVY85702.1 TetR/AcrR family transcriptional regulator [Brachybacterium sp. NBEC-018]